MGLHFPTVCTGSHQECWIRVSKIQLCPSYTATTPFSSGYQLEVDISALLDDIQANYYQNLIGILWRAIELGRIGIHVEVAFLASILAQPREGHLDQCLHVFAYLKKHTCSTMVFNDNLHNVDENVSFNPIRHNFTDILRKQYPLMCQNP